MAAWPAPVVSRSTPMSVMLVWLLRAARRTFLASREPAIERTWHVQASAVAVSSAFSRSCRRLSGRIDGSSSYTKHESDGAR